MAEAAIKWAAAAFALTLGFFLVLAAITNRWPTAVVVRNEVEDASCAIAFSDGFTWSVDLRRGEEKFWLFIFGPPDNAKAICSTPTRVFQDVESFSCNRNLSASGAFVEKFNIVEVGPDSGPYVWCVMASMSAGPRA